MSSQERRAYHTRQTRSQRISALDVDLNAAPAPIDLDAIDDDVIISSPQAFAEAKNKSRRNHRRAAVVDVDSEECSSRATSNNHNKHKRGRANQTTVNCELYINLEANINVKNLKPAAAPPPPPPKEPPAFSCPVCMGPLVEEMTTKCGHIFCKNCIKTSISKQGKCPTCRRKIGTKDVMRVYLPLVDLRG